MCMLHQEWNSRVFLGGLVVRIWHVHFCDPGSVPSQENWDPASHAEQQKKKKSGISELGYFGCKQVQQSCWNFFFFNFWTVFIIFKWSLTLEFYLCWLTFMDYSDSLDRFSTNNILAGSPWAWGTFQNGSFTHLHIPLCFCFVLSWLCCTTCGILTLGPGIEPWPQQWQHWALTTGPPGKSPFLCFEGVIKSHT